VFPLEFALSLGAFKVFPSKPQSASFLTLCRKSRILIDRDSMNGDTAQNSLHNSQFLYEQTAAKINENNASEK
jgi:hypothetical protein